MHINNRSRSSLILYHEASLQTSLKLIHQRILIQWQLLNNIAYTKYLEGCPSSEKKTASRFAQDLTWLWPVASFLLFLGNFAQIYKKLLLVVMNTFNKIFFNNFSYKYIEMDQPIITQDNPQPFIVNVKLLTNQVFQFEVNKNMKVSEFKSLISPKVNVPIQRMRIVFAGKQLLDDKPLSDYVSETGMTVHLIARSAPQPAQQTQNPPQNTQNVPQPSTSIPSQSQTPPNPFGDIMGMMGSIFGGQQPGTNPQIITSFGNLGNLGNLLGNLGVRPPTTQPPQTQPNHNHNHNHPHHHHPQTQPQNQTNVNSQTNQATVQQPQQSRISYAEIGQLNQSINNLNIPIDNVTTQNQILTPEGVIRYLRRLHHQSTRSMLQLNRLLSLAETNNNNTTYLEGFVPVFESLNSANNVAITSLNQLRQRRPQQNNNQNNQPNQPLLQSSPLISIVVSQTDQNGNTQVFRSQNSQATQNTNPVQQSQTNQPIVNPNPNNIPPVNPLQMLGGMNLGGLLGSLNSIGGINGLFGLSLRQMMSESGSDGNGGIFLEIFGSMSGQNMMQILTTKDFRFFREKHSEIRSNLKKIISQSSHSEVVQRITDEASQIIVPNRDHPMIQDKQKCRQQCRKNLKKHIQKLVEVTLSQNQPEYDARLLEIGKRALCENVDIIVSHTSNKNSAVAFQIIKYQAVSTMQPILPGIAGLFYGLLQRDILRVYSEYQAEQERRRQMSAEQQKSEQQLIQMIKEVGSRDSEKLSNMEHSQIYYKKE